MSFSYFAYGYTAWIFFSWFFVYMAQVRGLNLKSSALFTMLPFLSMTIGSLGGGVLSDRLTRRYGLLGRALRFGFGRVLLYRCFSGAGLACAEPSGCGRYPRRRCGRAVCLTKLILVSLGRHRGA